MFLFEKDTFYLGRTLEFKKEQIDRGHQSRGRDDSKTRDKSKNHNISTERSHLDLMNNLSFPSNAEIAELKLLRDENKNLKNVIESLKKFPRETIASNKLILKDSDPVTEETVKK